MGFPGGSVIKESACNAGDWGLTPGSEDPLEKEMTTHSSILARKIPRTENSGGFQSMESQQKLYHNHYLLKCRIKDINNIKVLSSWTISVEVSWGLYYYLLYCFPAQCLPSYLYLFILTISNMRSVFKK